MVKVKVCGITNPEDARAAAESGADAIGLVFAESPRKVGVEEAQEVAAALPDGVLKVGVFVSASEPSVTGNVVIGEIRQLIDAARRRASATVNAELTLLYWQVGRRIGQETLGGAGRG